MNPINMVAGLGLAAGLLAQVDSPEPEPAAVSVASGAGFRENRGQWDPRARFIWRRGDLAAIAEQGAIRFVKQRRRGDWIDGVVVRLSFAGGAATSEPTGRDRRPGVGNWFLGNDPARWRTGVPGFGSVVYDDLYPGIDLVLREHAGELEYEWIADPGADLGVIEIRVEGGLSTAVSGGDLVIDTSLGPLRQAAPVSRYADATGARVLAAGRFVSQGGDAYGFAVASDSYSGVPPSRSGLPLVVEPGLNWGTLLGGSSDEWCSAVGATPSGDVIVAGSTSSFDFPTTPGAYSRFHAGFGDGFVARLTADGSRLVYGTYVGGTRSDGFVDLAVFASGEVILDGESDSLDFPTTAGAFRTAKTSGGGSDTVVVRLDASGSALVYSTYVGPGLPYDMAVHPDGSPVIVGWAMALWPTTPGAYKTQTDLHDAFVTRLNPTGTGLVASTLLSSPGPLGSQDIATAVAVAPNGVVTVAGLTVPGQSVFPTTPGAYRRTHAGGYSDAFVTRLDPTFGTLVYSTLLGSTAGFDWPYALRVTEGGSAVIAGRAGTSGFPITAGVVGHGLAPASLSGTPLHNGFVTRLDPTGSALEFSTFLSPTPSTLPIWVELDASEAIYLVGTTWTDYYPATPGARDRTYARAGPHDADDGFVMKLSADATRYVYASFLGGSSNDKVAGAALLPSGDLLVVGSTQSPDFPVTRGAFQTSSNRPNDGFVVSERMLPDGVSRFGASTPSCRAPLTIDVTRMPSAGAADFGITSAGAMPNAWGVLALGARPDVAGTSVLGATVYLSTAATIVALPTRSDSRGALEQLLPLPAGAIGLRAFGQFLFPAGACAPTRLSASNALDITIR